MMKNKTVVTISIFWILFGFLFFDILEQLGLLIVWLIISILVLLPILVLNLKKNTTNE